MEWDPGKAYLPHYYREILRVKPKEVTGTYCGSSVFASKGNEYKICLAPVGGAFSITATGRLGVGDHWGCLLKNDGSVKCWGGASPPGLRINGGEYVFAPAEVVPATQGFTKLVANGQVACGVIEGSARCWGAMDEIWDLPPDKPTVVPGLENGVLDIARTNPVVASIDNSNIPSTAMKGRGVYGCAIVDGGKVKCWGPGRGFNADGTFGAPKDSTNDEYRTAIYLPRFTAKASALALGNSNSCVVAEGSIYCWGNSKEPKDKLYTIPSIESGASAVAVGNIHACAIVHGNVLCWGDNGLGQLGVGGVTDSEEPISVPGLSKVKQIVANQSLSCAIMKGEVWCWGNSVFTPTKVEHLPSDITEIAIGINMSCALSESNKVFCWRDLAQNAGVGGSGEKSTRSPFSTPYIPTRSAEDRERDTQYLPERKTLADLKPVTKITAGVELTCIILEDQSVRCWGGKLSKDIQLPKKMASLFQVSSISSGLSHTCVVDGGNPKCWGKNDFGQLGGGELKKESLEPIWVTGLSNVTEVSAGYDHTCAILPGGAVKCWGRNHHGQLGNATTTDSLLPVDVQGLSSGVTAIVLGFDHSCAIASGRALCWGKNDCSGDIGGQLGNNTTLDSPTPVNVEGLSSGVTAISAGDCHTCAIHEGALKCWGNNEGLQLGNDKVKHSLVPMPVSGLESGTTTVAAGASHNCAIQGGELKCWGRGLDGELGTGSVKGEKSSVPLPVSYLPKGVSFVEAMYHTCAIVEKKPYCWGPNISGDSAIAGRVGNRFDSRQLISAFFVPIFVPILE